MSTWFQCSGPVERQIVTQGGHSTEKPVTLWKPGGENEEPEIICTLERHSLKFPPPPNPLLRYKSSEMKSHVRYRIPSYMLLAMEAPDAPQTTEATAIAYGCPLEPDGKTLLLKTQHTWVAGSRETKAEFTSKLPLCWIVFIVLKV